MTLSSKPARLHWARRIGAKVVVSSLAAIVVLGGITPPAFAGADENPVEKSPTTPAAGSFGYAPEVTSNNLCSPVEPTCEEPPPPPPPGCNFFRLDQSVSRGDNPEFGGPYTHITFSSRVSCQNANATFVEARLYDRTPGYSGIVRAIGSGGSWSTASSGSKDFYDVDYYPAAQRLEQVLVVNVSTTPIPGMIWVCNPSPNLRFIWCDDLGNGRASVGIGFFEFATGVTDPCSDPNRTKTDEEATQLTFSSLVDDVRITFHPFIKWCWSGSNVVKISKYSKAFAHCDFDHPTWCDSEHFNIRPTTTDPDPFAVNGIGQYVVSFTVDITPPPFPASNLRAQTCIYVIDRIYRANGQKEIKDKLVSCQNR